MKVMEVVSRLIDVEEEAHNATVARLGVRSAGTILTREPTLVESSALKINATSIPDYHARRQILRFPPPMVALAADPVAFDFNWRLLQFCFDFPDPSAAVRCTDPLGDVDLVMLTRFHSKAKSLAASPFLGHPTSMSINVGQTMTGLQIERINTSFPHEESERGFMTLLRQFAHKGEPASFKQVEAMAMQRDAAGGGANGDLLRGWGRIHKKLLHRNAEAWAYIKGLPDQPIREVPHAMDPRVDQLLRTYLYGDIIHFGEGRDELERLSATTFDDANTRMSLYRGASDLAMFYMGYATVLQGIFHLVPASRAS
jgi:hypothetical protein